VEGPSGASAPVLAQEVSFAEFLARLVQCAKVYGELVLVKTADARINRHLRNLRMIKAVQTYGFLMHLRVGACPDRLFREVLKLTESFVLRRHVCRERAESYRALCRRMTSSGKSSPARASRRT
jgi:predicted secreted protein